MLFAQEAGNLEDPNWRVPPPNFMEQQYMGGGFTFGVPNAEHLDFSGPGGPALATSKLSSKQEAIACIKVMLDATSHVSITCQSLRRLKAAWVQTLSFCDASWQKLCVCHYSQHHSCCMMHDSSSEPL